MEKLRFSHQTYGGYSDGCSYEQSGVLRAAPLLAWWKRCWLAAYGYSFGVGLLLRSSLQKLRFCWLAGCLLV